MKRLLPLLLCLLWLLPAILRAQTGGDHIYQFLNLSPSPRISALGGNLIAVVDDDVSLAFVNPGLLNPQMHQQIAFSHAFFVAGINHGYAAYGHHIDKWGATVHGGINYVSYGEIDRTNAFFQKEGTFKAADYAITFGGAKTVYERINLGVNLKVISSNLEGFTSWGLAADASAVYQDTAKNFTATFLFRNMGAQLSVYAEGGERETLPFEIQFGFSKKLRYLPFRFSVTYRHLEDWDILYDDPNDDGAEIFFGQDAGQRTDFERFADNLFQHFVFNGEFLFGEGENLRLRFGYNHLLRNELSIDGFGSLSGFTFGAGFKINRFRIDYGRTNWHVGGGTNHFSIATNFQEF